MKYSPLTKGGGAKRQGVVRSILRPLPDNPLKAPLSLRLPSPFVKGEYFQRSRTCRQGGSDR